MTAGKLLQKISVLLAAGILAAASINMSPVQAETSGTIDTDKLCSITYQLETGAHSEKVTADGGNLVIYQVADIQTGDNGYYYNVLPDFENAGIDFAQYTGEEGQKEFEKNNSDWADKLDSYVKDHSIQPDRTEKFNKGYLEINDLSVGLYLIVQTEETDGYEKLNPFLVTLPRVENEEYVYSFDASLKMAVKAKETPDNPPAPDKKNTAPTHTGGKLPQTGQLWWPIPILLAAGAVLIIVGAVRRKNQRAHKVKS